MADASVDNIIGQEVLETILNENFHTRSKKEMQILLLRAMVKAGLIRLNDPVPTDLSLKLGMDARQLERLLYTTYLNCPELQSNGLYITQKELTDWNATTTSDARKEQIRFEVPSQVDRVKLDQYFKKKGIQAENGRNNYILIVYIDRIVSVMNQNIPDEVLNGLSKSYSKITASINQAETKKGKLLATLQSGSSFVIQTVVAAIINQSVAI